MVETEQSEFTAPSGDIYEVKRLTYRERKDVMRRATKIELVANPKTKETSTTQTVDIYTMQEQMAVKCITKAPWLAEGKRPVLEDLDKIKVEDADELDKFIDSVNFPKGSVEEN